MPVTRPYPQPPTRATIVARCAALVAHREDQDPNGAAYQATSLQLDDALSALFQLGPRDVWGDPD
jgi:hypothetical protein